MRRAPADWNSHVVSSADCRACRLQHCIGLASGRPLSFPGQYRRSSPSAFSFEPPAGLPAHPHIRSIPDCCTQPVNLGTAFTRSRPCMKKNQDLTLKEQIRHLRRLGEDLPLTKVAVICAATGAACIFAFFLSTHETLNVFLLFFAGFFVLTAFAISTQLPQLKRAARATRSGRRIQGVLHLTVNRSDSENLLIEGDIRQGPTTWKLHFSRPFGWTPQSGDWPCELVMLADDAIPALVELDQGLLFPTRKSHKTFSGSI